MFGLNKSTIRSLLFNVENLFLYLHEPEKVTPESVKDLTEAQWQHLGNSTVELKSLKKLHELANSILHIDADFILLNEVGGVESLENFNRLFLQSKYEVHLKEGNSDRGIDVGYLVKKELNAKILLISHKNRPIDFLYPHETKTPAGGTSHYFSRDVAELRVFAHGQNTPSLVYLLTHLKSKLDPEGIDHLGRGRRMAELNTLVKIYNEVKKELNNECPIVVAGDLNGLAQPEKHDEEYKAIYQDTDLAECFHALNIPNEERFTQVQIIPGGYQQLMQLDYIFVSGSFKGNLRFAESYRFRNHLGEALAPPVNMEERSLLPSDHYPVVMDLELLIDSK
jgi:exonuclease III